MSTSEPEIIDFPGSKTVVVRGTDVSVDDLPKFIDSAYAAIGSAIKDGHVAPAGVGFTRYDSEFNKIVTLEVGFPVEDIGFEFLEIDGVTVQASELPAGKTMITRHEGTYDKLHDAWGKFRHEIKRRGYEPGDCSWEAYDVGPRPGRPPSDYITGLAVPLIEKKN